MNTIAIHFKSVGWKSYVAGLLLLLCWNYIFMKEISAQDNSQYSKTIKAIAHDIAALQSEFPQLKNFSVTENINLERLIITYQFNTHRSEHGGGWTGGVPNPDDDGIWFYIDIHDSDSKAQIHTQPITAKLCLQDKRVSFLILEGSKTKPISSHIWSVLKNHGIKTCQ